jgi:hypothetical protein
MEAADSFGRRKETGMPYDPARQRKKHAGSRVFSKQNRVSGLTFPEHAVY